VKSENRAEKISGGENWLKGQNKREGVQREKVRVKDYDVPPLFFWNLGLTFWFGILCNCGNGFAYLFYL